MNLYKNKLGSRLFHMVSIATLAVLCNCVSVIVLYMTSIY